MKVVGIFIFMTCWITGFISWCYGIIELIGVSRFKISFFKYGKVVLKSSEPISFNQTSVRIGEEYSTKTGKFKLINSGECLFRPKFEFFQLRIHTPFPIKGIIRWSEGETEIEGRLPLAPILFFGAWLVGWSVGGLMASVTEGWVVLPFILFGWTVLGTLALISIPLELKRARLLISEIKQAQYQST